MKKILTLIILGWWFSAHAQIASEEIEDFCIHENTSNLDQLIPKESGESVSSLVGCTFSTLEEFNQFAPFELYQVLVDIEDPFDCLYRVLVSFNTTESPALFSESNVQFIANQAQQIFIEFDGTHDNGSLSLMTYLGLAVQFSADFPSRISYSSQTWDTIEETLLAYANNSSELLDSEVGLFTTAHFINACSRDSLNSSVEIMQIAGSLLDDIATDGYDNLNNIYPYYFCYYYLLDIYFRYAPLNEAFLTELSNQPDLINSLRDVAINTNLKSNTYTHFDDLSNFSVTGLINMIEHDPVQAAIIAALNDVNDTYESFSPQWLSSALELAEHDENFEHTSESIIQDLRQRTLPNSYSFDQGTFIIETPLSYDEAQALYQGAQEVRAQFFRMIGDHSVVPEDQNDTVRAVVYGTRQDYSDYNNLLYGINFPNSGGVYIEQIGAFFTYQRTENESQFTLEELFRHEYIHYLQARYLIPGQWGVAEVYQNSRLVWLEEGMAQFLSGSTRSDGVGLLEVTRERINNHGNIQGFDQIFNSSYGSGNALAYYDFSPMLWHYLYEHDNPIIDELLIHLKSEEIILFDSLVNVIEHDSALEQSYVDYVNQNLMHDSLWHTPATPGVPLQLLVSVDTSEIKQDIVSINSRFNPSTASIHTDGDIERYVIQGQWSSTSDSDIEDDINELLVGLGSQDSIDPLNYNVAYYATESDSSSITFFIEGPLGQICSTPEREPAISVDSAHALLFHFAEGFISRNIRVREIGQSIWDYDRASSHNAIDSILNLGSVTGYEFQIQYVCNESSVSPYSETREIYPCHQNRVITEDITTDQNLYSADDFEAFSSIINESKVGFFALNDIELHPGFLVEEGSQLEIDRANCASGDFANNP